MSVSGATKPDGRRVFAVPAGLAAASSLGFAAAFLWGDIGRYVCWLGIGLPLIVVAWVAVRMSVRRNFQEPPD